jgi:hypothetical protein
MDEVMALTSQWSQSPHYECVQSDCHDTPPRSYLFVVRPQDQDSLAEKSEAEAISRFVSELTAKRNRAPAHERGTMVYFR